MFDVLFTGATVVDGTGAGRTVPRAGHRAQGRSICGLVDTCRRCFPYSPRLGARVDRTRRQPDRARRREGSGA